MRFKEFLVNEAERLALAKPKHRQKITIEEANTLLKSYCKQALSFFDAPLWRGFSGTDDAYLIQGDKAQRVSANTSNHYTVIMDEYLPTQGYPKRSASIIMANNENKNAAEGFGTVYAIFPFDGVKIGVCEYEDIWRTLIKIGYARREKSIDQWNEFLSGAGIPDYSYEDLSQGIKETITNPDDSSYNLMSDVFGTDADKVDSILKAGYSATNLGTHLATTADINKYNDRERELWIGGKCIAIHEDIWEKMLDERGGHPDKGVIEDWKAEIEKKYGNDVEYVRRGGGLYAMVGNKEAGVYYEAGDYKVYGELKA